MEPVTISENSTPEECVNFLKHILADTSLGLEKQDIENLATNIANRVGVRRILNARDTAVMDSMLDMMDLTVEGHLSEDKRKRVAELMFLAVKGTATQGLPEFWQKILNGPGLELSKETCTIIATNIQDVIAEIKIANNQKEIRKTLAYLKRYISENDLEKLVKRVYDEIFAAKEIKREEELRVLQRLFENTYKDPNGLVDDFIHYLRMCAIYFRKYPKIIFSPYFALIQGSGYGKTRLMREVARKVRMVYLCARKADVNGFPKRHDTACNLLFDYNRVYKDRDEATSAQAHRLVALIYVAQKSKLHDELDKKFAEGFSDLWKKFANIINGNKQDDPKFRRKMIKEIKAKRIKDGLPELVLCIDEARTLLDHYPIRGVSLFRIVSGALTELSGLFQSDCIMFGVFLDTNSVISNFTPATRWDPSYRVDVTEGIKGQRLFHPYVLMRSFDSLFDILYGWKSLGRPLTAIAGKCGNASDVFAKIVNGIVNAMDNYGACVALFVARIALYVSPQSMLARELVANHMISLTNVHSNHEDVLATTVSEPFLAVAACIAWEMKPPLKEILSAIDQALIGGAVCVGFTGELVAQILCVLAYDEARRNPSGAKPDVSKKKSIKTKKEEGNKQKDPPADWPVPSVSAGEFVPLIDFLMALFPKEYNIGLTAGKVPKELNSKVVLNAMSEKLREGRVCCLQMVSISQPTTKEILEELLYSRTCAVLKRGHNGIDLVIPVANKGDEDLLGVVAISVKNAKRTREDKWKDKATTKLNPEFCFGEDSNVVSWLLEKATNGNLAYLPIYAHVGSTLKKTPLEMENAIFEFKNHKRKYAANCFALFGLSSSMLDAERGSDLVAPLERIRAAWTDPLEFIKKSCDYNETKKTDVVNFEPLPMQFERPTEDNRYSYWSLYADAKRIRLEALNRAGPSGTGQEIREETTGDQEVNSTTQETTIGTGQEIREETTGEQEVNSTTQERTEGQELKGTGQGTTGKTKGKTEVRNTRSKRSGKRAKK